MESEISAIIGYHFSDLEDPRIERTKLHKLSNILVIAICAIIGCSDNWEDVADYGEAKKEWFQTFLDLENGKRGIKGKRLLAGWKEDYLIKVLNDLDKVEN